MTQKRLLCGTLAVFLVLLASDASNAMPARAKSAQFRSTRPGYSEYLKVLDTVFPRKSFSRYYLVLRYIPAFEPESQIIISENVDKEGIYDVDYYFLPKGSKKIGEQLSALHSMPTSESPEELATHIKVEHKRIEIPQPVISRLMASFFAMRIRPKLETDVFSDPTIYDLWYITLSAGNELFLSVEDIDFGHKVMYPHVRWMNEVKRVVMAAAEASK